MLRERIARWLAPWVFENAERLDYMGERVRELRDWCEKDSPEVGAAARWVLENCRWHWMSIEAWRAEVTQIDHRGLHLRGTIVTFRDWLRAQRAANQGPSSHDE